MTIGPPIPREGVVTALEYREGKSSVVTIGGIPYVTDFRFEDIDWKFGDTVTFDQLRTPVPRAANIRKKE